MDKYIELVNQRYGYATAKLAEACEHDNAYDTIYWRGYKDAMDTLLKKMEGER